MTNVTQILARIEQGDPAAAEQLLPLVYDELRKLAAAKMAQENPGQTLQATALVHEAYLRLVGRSAEEGEKVRQSEGETGNESHLSVSRSLRPSVPAFSSRGHFFAAAAEAMRRILVEAARRKSRQKRGGDLARVELVEDAVAAPEIHEDLVALDAALDRLKEVDPQAVQLVHLRYFVGLSIPQAADNLGISPRTADRLWAFARAWLHREIAGLEGRQEEK